MDYLLGLLTGAAFFVCILTAYIIGRRGQAQVKHTEQADPEIKRKAKEMQQGLQGLMSYDVSQALERKKVT